MPNVDIRRDLGRLGSQARASRVHRFGIPIRPAGFTVQYDVDRKQLAKPRRQGLTVKQIAPRCGCSVTTVERALRRYGIGR